MIRSECSPDRTTCRAASRTRALAGGPASLRAAHRRSRDTPPPRNPRVFFPRLGLCPATGASRRHCSQRRKGCGFRLWAEEAAGIELPAEAGSHVASDFRRKLAAGIELPAEAGSHTAEAGRHERACTRGRSALSCASPPVYIARTSHEVACYGRQDVDT